MRTTPTVRPLAALAERDHDLVVVGGGVHGCFAALDAARRGLRVALVERADFGGATSSASHRILHGGLRYLQSLDLARSLESIRERRWFLRHFPELCAPLRCSLPLYGEGMRKPAPFRAALAMNAVLSARRNAGVRTDHALALGSVLPGSRAPEVNPYCRREGLLGLGVWHDGLVLSHARLTMEALRWAASLGAMIARGARAVEIETRRSGVTRLIVEDASTGARYAIKAAGVINAAGPWCAEVADHLDRAVPNLFRPTLAFNLLLDRPAPDGACAVVAPDAGARTYFLAPRHGLMMAGTTHLALDAFRDRPTDAEVRAMVDDLNRASPTLKLAAGDVLRVDAGVLPASSTDPAEPSHRARVVHHRDIGGPDGLVSLVGVKYTTGRAHAAQGVALVAGERPITPAGRERPSPAPWSRDLNLIDPGWARGRDLASWAGAIRELTDDEGARTLGDILYRRTEWGQDPRGVREVGERVTSALGWDSARTGREIADLERGASRAPDEEPART